MDLEAQLNRLEVRGDEGERTFVVNVGASAANNHVAIDEMLPHRTLNLVTGDEVLYVWPDRHNVHTVSFPTGSTSLPGPFGFDCGSSYNSSNTGPPPFCLKPGDSRPEFIADPGT